MPKRVYEHKNKLVDGFSKKYNVSKLVYYEVFENVEDAIASEKRIKKWRREWKMDLILGANPKLRDLSVSLC